MKAWLTKVAIASIAVLAPIQGALITAIILILCDMVFGVMAAYKRKEKIVSAGFRRTVTKFFVYLGAIVLSFLTEKYLLSGVMPVTKIVSGVIGLTELKSILEALNEISGKDLLAEALKKLGSDNDIKG